MPDELPQECCENCKHCHVGTNRGKCHRFPPVLDPATHPSLSQVCRWEHPIVMLDDWCGEFQPRKDANLPENPILDMPIRDMYVSVRCRHSLRNHVDSVRDLVAMTPDQVLQIRNLGETSLTEIREWLSAHGLYLKGDTWRKGDS